MRKLFSILFVFALTLGFVAGEKRIVGVRVNNQIMLLRVDLANYAMDASTDGANWNAIPGTSGIADNALSLSKLAQVSTGSILGNVSGSTGNVTTLSASDLKTLIGTATTSSAGLMSSTDKTALGSRAASGVNSDITSMTGLTTALSIAQGGTGATTASGALSALGALASPTSPAQGDILYFNGTSWANLSAGTSGQFFQTQGAGANPKWATVTGGSGTGDVTGPSSATDSHLAAFDGTSGKIIKDAGVLSSSFATAGANSNILSLSGLTTPLSVTQGGTGLNSLGTAGQVLTVNSGATGLQFATPSGGGLLIASGSGYALSNGSTGRGTIGTKAVSLDYADGGSTIYGALGNYSAVSGGYCNMATTTYAAICGGYINTASGTSSAIIGGYQNIASALRATVGGGYTNTASGNESFIGGGNTNTASGVCATVSGGKLNTASGDYSYSGGYYGVSTHYGGFSWASGRFSALGDSQKGWVSARIATDSTDAPTVRPRPVADFLEFRDQIFFCDLAPEKPIFLDFFKDRTDFSECIDAHDSPQ